jgi:predicted negative regulator of RcsB-dependent stress response
MADNRNVLYLIIGVLVVAVGILGFNVYQARKQPEGLQINVGPNGLKIESK